MTTMHERYGEPNDALGQHIACPKCECCLTCADCVCQKPTTEESPEQPTEKGIIFSNHAFKRLVVRKERR